MGSNTKTLTAVSIAAIISLGIGVAIGVTIKKGEEGGGAVAAADPNLKGLPVEELQSKLSDVMLPEDEFGKLSAAIYQTAMGLFMAQAQQAQVQVTEAIQQDLKKSIEDKYSRKYFADLNAKSMTEFTKDDLVTTIGYYQTEPGQKFLKQSPKIISATMQAVQADLTQWLPKTVEEMVAKLKGGAPAGEKAEGEKDKEEQKLAPKAGEEKAPGENS